MSEKTLGHHTEKSDKLNHQDQFDVINISGTEVEFQTSKNKSSSKPKPKEEEATPSSSPSP